MQVRGYFIKVAACAIFRKVGAGQIFAGFGCQFVIG
jgi:hypothetical protein